MRRAPLFGLGILAFALVVGTSTGGDNKGDVKKGNLPSGWKALNLTAVQKESVYKIQADYGTKIDALNKQLATLQKEQRQELLKILTPQQKAQLIGEEAKGEEKK